MNEWLRPMRVYLVRMGMNEYLLEKGAYMSKIGFY